VTTEVIWICGEGLCFDNATHECAVIGGPTLHFCAKHAARLVEQAREAGISARIAMTPPIDESKGGDP
jgi:hypothetical protein